MEALGYRLVLSWLVPFEPLLSVNCRRYRLIAKALARNRNLAFVGAFAPGTMLPSVLLGVGPIRRLPLRLRHFSRSKRWIGCIKMIAPLWTQKSNSRARCKILDRRLPWLSRLKPSARNAAGRLR